MSDVNNEQIGFLDDVEGAINGSIGGAIGGAIEGAINGSIEGIADYLTSEQIIGFVENWKSSNGIVGELTADQVARFAKSIRRKHVILILLFYHFFSIFYNRALVICKSSM